MRQAAGAKTAATQCFQIENILPVLPLVLMRNTVSRKKLRNFWETYPDSEESLKTWNKVTMKANWKASNEVKAQYRNSGVIGDNRIVFNICGNEYRLIVKFNYQMQRAWIRFIGAHPEYDRIDASTI